MAAPRHQRAGFSRRARYGLFAGYVAAVAGVLAGLLLVLAARFDPSGFASLRMIAADATRPITEGGRAMLRGIGDAGGAIGAYWDAGSKNRAMRAELDAARARLVEAKALELDNRRLKRTMRLVERTPEVVATTRVIGSTFASPRRLATLSAGSLSGVEAGQPVRSAEGLVGRVVETGRFASRVLLVTDPVSTVPVRIARSGVAALATGRGDGWIELRALIAGATPFRRGDIVITSGTGGVFPPGIPVAVVTSAKSDTASAWPLADPARLDYAVVMRPFQPDLPPAAPVGAPPAQAPAPANP